MRERRSAAIPGPPEVSGAPWGGVARHHPCFAAARSGAGPGDVAGGPSCGVAVSPAPSGRLGAQVWQPLRPGRGARSGLVGTLILTPAPAA